MKQILTVRLESFFKRDLNREANRLANSIISQGGNVSGPIPLPNKVKRFTLLGAPFKHKKSQENYVFIAHRRLIYIYDPSREIMGRILNTVTLSTVNFEVKVKAK